MERAPDRHFAGGRRRTSGRAARRPDDEDRRGALLNDGLGDGAEAEPGQRRVGRRADDDGRGFEDLPLLQHDVLRVTADDTRLCFEPRRRDLGLERGLGKGEDGFDVGLRRQAAGEERGQRDDDVGAVDVSDMGDARRRCERRSSSSCRGRRRSRPARRAAAPARRGQSRARGESRRARRRPRSPQASRPRRRGR